MRLKPHKKQVLTNGVGHNESMAFGNGASKELHGEESHICRAGVGLSLLATHHPVMRGGTYLNVVVEAGSGQWIPGQVQVLEADKHNKQNIQCNNQ